MSDKVFFSVWKRLAETYFTVTTDVQYGLVHENGVAQTIFTQDILTMFRNHDDLLLARFKNWKELRCVVQILPGFTFGRYEACNGGLLDM